MRSVRRQAELFRAASYVRVLYLFASFWLCTAAFAHNLPGVSDHLRARDMDPATGRFRTGSCGDSSLIAALKCEDQAPASDLDAAVIVRSATYSYDLATGRPTSTVYGDGSCDGAALHADVFRRAFRHK